MKNIKNIAILWWFWNWNLWDDTILYNEIKLLKEFYWEKTNILVFSNNPKYIEQTYKWVKWEYLPPIMWYRFYKFFNFFYLFKLYKIFRNTDLLILWWWGFFSDRQFFAISWWLRYCKIAKKFWTNIIWFWMWAWPFFHNINKKIIKKSDNLFNFISLRDDKSLNYFLDIWFNKNKLFKFIDPAFFTEKYNVKKDNSIWFIFHSNKNFYEKQIKLFLEKSNYNIKLIITDYLDIDYNKNIIDLLNNSRIKLIIPQNSIELVKEISKTDFIFSERLHWSIISFTQKVPFTNIYYHHKWKELSNLLDIKIFSVNISNIKNYNLLDFLEKKDKFRFKNLDLINYKEVLFKKLRSFILWKK